MKRIIYIALALLLALPGNAQIEQAAKSVFTLTTFKKDGSILASSHGVFVDENGTALGTWTPFIGADHAIVVDARGRQADVTAIIGANELYDVCKFRVAGKTSAASVAKVPSKKGDKIWILGYSIQKPQIDQRNVQNTEKFMNKYTYYILSSNAPENAASCPLVNSRGEVLGLLQHSKDYSQIYATDAQYINSFHVENGLAISDPVLKQTEIPVAYPDNLEQANVMLALAQSQADSAHYQQYVKSFMEQFPTAVEGYTAKAQSLAAAKNYAGADEILKNAIKKVSKKDEAHMALSRLVYQKAVLVGDSIYPTWNLDKALEEAKTAYAINPQPVYQHLQAQIIYAKGDYQTAYDMFLALTKSPIRNGEFFYEAAQCKTQLKAPSTEIITLLDSAVAASPQPLNAMGAPYVLARGSAYFDAGDYRNAVKDFNQYDTLMSGRPLNSEFYYTRQKAEMQIHQYQQALNDITRAVVLSRDNPVLWAEKASLHLRFNQLEDAIKSASICTKLAPEYSDGYIVLGIAQMINKNKSEGEKALLKAKELGDTRADGYLKKYK